MAFIIEKLNKGHKHLPEGFYIVLEGIEYRIEEITISASGKICLKYRDPLRKTTGLTQVCTLEELIGTIDGAEFREH
jgi:hypothetical protein